MFHCIARGMHIDNEVQGGDHKFSTTINMYAYVNKLRLQTRLYMYTYYRKDTRIFLQEKVDALRVLGADVRPVPAVPFDNPDNYNHQARKGGDNLACSQTIFTLCM